MSLWAGKGFFATNTIMKKYIFPGFFLFITCFLAACGNSAQEDRSFPNSLDEGNSSQLGAENSNYLPVPLPAGGTDGGDPAGGGDSSTVIHDFLWKPESERDGHVAVLVNPRNVRVEVTGDVSETLSNTGPSNGRGTTARGRFTGCRYGDNVSVEFFSSSGARIKVKDGRTAVRIADGCKRVEFRL